MSNPTRIPAAGPVFQEGDRVLCADGLTRTVKAMAPHRTGEPARVVVEDGTEWIAANCRRANPADLACARQAFRLSIARAHQADPGDPQWRAARQDLNATRSFLVLADPDSVVPEGPDHGQEEDARELEELERRTAPAVDEEERALREEVAAHFVVLSHDGRAHGFQAVHARGCARPIAWTYRTGYGHAVRYGWALAGGRLRTEHPEAVYRWQAEEDAASSVLTLTARGEGDTSIVDSLAHASLDELREALARLQDRAARTRGTSPNFVLDENVRAALEVLAACHFAEVPHDFNANVDEGAEGHDPSVTGLVVEPAGGGNVTAYWVERGRYVTAAGDPFTEQLRSIRAKFQEAGWTVVPGGRRVVTAYRPTS